MIGLGLGTTLGSFQYPSVLARASAIWRPFLSDDLTDYTPNGNDLQLGSTAGADSSDPSVVSGGLQFTEDDFAKAADAVVTGTPWTLAVKAKVTDKPAQTFARADTGTFVDVNGVVQPSASGNLRDKHHLTDNTSTHRRVTLLERVSANGWTYSEDLSNAAWTKANTTISADAATAPDGTTTADKINGDSGTGERRLQRNTPALTDNITSSWSFFVKWDGSVATWLTIDFLDKSNSVSRSSINISTGTLGTNNHSLTIEALADGWYRVTARKSVGAGATAPNVKFYLATVDAGTSITTTGTEGPYLWGIQFEADQPVPSSYIPTTAATDARAADSFTVDLLDATPQEATYLYEGVVLDLPGTGGINYRYLFNVGDAGNGVAGQLGAYLEAGSNRIYLAFRNDSSEVTGFWLTPSLALGDYIVIRIYQASSGAVTAGLTINGAAEDTTLDAAIPTQALPSTWYSPAVRFSKRDSSSYPANSGLISFKAQSGAEKSLATMQALTNPDIAYYATGMTGTRTLLAVQEYGADYPHFSVALDSAERVIYSARDDAGAAVVTDEGTSVAADSTHVLVVTNDGTTVKTYLDGVLQDTVAHSGSYTVDTLVLGAIVSDVATRALQGEVIAYAAAWPEALSAYEVARLTSEIGL